MIPQTQYLKIIPFEPSIHSPLIYKWYHSGEYEDFFGNISELTIDTINQMQPFFYMVVNPQDINEIYGLCSMTSIEERNRNLYLGIMVDKQYQGKSMFREVLKLMIYFIMNSMNMYKVIGRIRQSSSKWIERIKEFGFIEEGTLRKHVYSHGEFHDMVIVSMLKGEFNKRYKQEIERPIEVQSISAA